VANEKANGSSTIATGTPAIPNTNSAVATGAPVAAAVDTAKPVTTKQTISEVSRKPPQNRRSSLPARELAKVKAKRAAHRRNLRASNTAG
jgi:hypothetical protein